MTFSRLLLAGIFISVQMSTALAAELDFSVTITNPSCAGLSDGAISITPENGVPDYRVYIFGPGDYSSRSFENTELAAGQYSVRVEDSNDDFIVKQIVLTSPAVAEITMDDVNSICSDEIVMSANPSGPGFGRWSVISGSGNFLDPYSPNSAVSEIGSGVNIYRWSIYIDDCITFDEVEIINNKAAVSVINEMTVCSGSAQLSGNWPSEGATGYWSIVSGAGIFQDGENSASDATVHGLAYGANEFRWTINNQGCESSDIVVVNYALPHPVNAGRDQEIGGTITYMSAGAVVQGEGTWNLISGGGTIEDVTDPNTRITDLRPGPNVFRWIVANGYCIDYDEVVVISDELPPAEAGFDYTICTDETWLNAADPGPGIGSWSIVSGSAVFEERHAPDTRVSNLSSGENILRWTVSNGVYESHDDVVITNNFPDEASAGDDFVIHESSVTLNALAPSIGTGIWSLMSGGGIFDDPVNSNTIVRNLLPGENILRWTVSNNYCMSYDEVVVTYQVATAIGSAPEQRHKMSLFPNPASDKLYISLEGYGAPIRVEIHSLAGAKVLDELLNNAESPSIDVIGLEAGTYVVTVHHEDGIRSGHFVKR